LPSGNERDITVNEYKRVNAADLWLKLATAAHASGEPGVVFLDRYNDLSTANGAEKIISVNPCGEQGLGAYSVCNLGAINLNAFVRDGVFDHRGFDRTVGTAIRFLDNVVDKTHYHLPETKEQQLKLRRIGLGVMGLADALINLKIRYGSSEAVEFTEDVFSQMKLAAVDTSIEIATQKGPAHAWRPEMWDRPYLRGYKDKFFGGMSAPPLRNIFLLTQAPTGTTAALAGVNSGIEPYFSFSYTRVDRTGTHKVVSPIAMQAASVDNADDWGKRVPYLVTANEVSVKEHLLMQTAVQKYVDSSVSKTINAPKGQKVEEVLEAYTMAYDLGLKGLAYYRDGSRDKQVLYREDPNKKIEELEAKIAQYEQTVNNFRFFAGNTVFDKTLDNGGSGVVLSMQSTDSDVCPVCGGKKVYQEGCQKCASCSWAAC
jgi:ribonucleoside-diphosphate reductase alpha chain